MLKGLLKVLPAGTVAALLALGCGQGSHNPASTSGAGGKDAGVGAAQAGSGATPSQGGSATAAPADAAAACREYFTTVCARIRECGAPTFRPCESPIDACPDILFADGSNWTAELVKSCTAAWKTQSCDALEKDEGPECSKVLGKRALGTDCAFDAQCQSRRCNGGVVPRYDVTCGKCADVAPSHGACSDEHVCPSGQSCEAGTCTDLPVAVSVSCQDGTCPGNQYCNRGVCQDAIPLGGVCTAGSKCGAGLGCGIEVPLKGEAEPQTGTCQPIPPIGQPCLPTFVSLGICEAAGSCDSRPTGQCVPRAKVGESCGYVLCEAGAECNIFGYHDVPTHQCFALRPAGGMCDPTGADQGKAQCAADLECLCADGACQTGVCTSQQKLGEPCDNADKKCAAVLVCIDGKCATPPASQKPVGTVQASLPCERSSRLGREEAKCLAGLECLCTDDTCAMPVCAAPRVGGESCDGKTQVCRQGFVCNSGQCADAPERHLDAFVCAAKP